MLERGREGEKEEGRGEWEVREMLGRVKKDGVGMRNIMLLNNDSRAN